MPSPIKPNREIAISSTTNRELATVTPKEKEQLASISKEKITPLTGTGSATKPSKMLRTKPPYDLASIEDAVAKKLGSIPQFSFLTKDELITALQYSIKINLNAPECSQKTLTQADMIIIPGLKKILFLGEHSDQFGHNLYRVGEQYSIDLTEFETITLSTEEWDKLAKFLQMAAEALQTLLTAQKTEKKATSTTSTYKPPVAKASTTQSPTTTESTTFSHRGETTTTRETVRQEERHTSEAHATQEFRSREKERKKKEKQRSIEEKRLESDRLSQDRLQSEIRKKTNS
jgi:hypothetical protein